MISQESKTIDSDLGKEFFKEMSRSILPIAAKTDKEKMKGVGSCTLLAIDDVHHYIVTVAHVLRKWGEYKLFIITETKSIEITWPFVMTNKKGEENCDYSLDIAFSPITPELQNLLSENHVCLLADGFNRNGVSFDDELLFAFGYPSSKITFDKQKKVFKLTPFQYFGKEINDSRLLERSCSIVGDHLLSNFVKRKTKKPQKEEYIIAPDPYGISGGGLFRVFVKNDHPEIFVLEGILTEWHSSLSLMKCAKSQKVKKIILG